MLQRHRPTGLQERNSVREIVDRSDKLTKNHILS